VSEDARNANPSLERVYDQLRVIAARLLGSGAGHTLQPTAIVHEAYIKLASADSSEWESESHFLAVAAKALRQVLVDHYRTSNREKRGGGRAVWTLDTSIIDVNAKATDPVMIDEALTRLADEDPRAAEIVEMRFFGGMTNDQIADRLGVSTPTVVRDWRFARAWLHAELEDADGAER